MSWPYETLEKAYRVLGAIADRGDGARVSTTMLEEDLGKDRRSFEPVMGCLRGAELVDSYQGTSGGYSLQRPAHLITFLDITNAVYEATGLARCARDEDAPMCEGCVGAGECYFRDVFVEARRGSDCVLRKHRLRPPPQ